MELVVAVLFFTLSSSLCITMFVRAHMQSENAKALNHALNICTDAAELIRTSDSVSEASDRIKEVYSRAEPGSTEENLTVFFDANYEMVTESAAANRLYISMLEQDGVLLAEIAFFDRLGTEVYRLSIRHAI